MRDEGIEAVGMIQPAVQEQDGGRVRRGALPDMQRQAFGIDSEGFERVGHGSLLPRALPGSRAWENRHPRPDAARVQRGPAGCRGGPPVSGRERIIASWRA